jgi:Raf kinase inhibitor-like YbhB/YbcL family protein
MERFMNSINQLAFIRLIFLLFSCFHMTAAFSAEGEQNMTLILKSADFTHQGEIPKLFTCDGNDSSPALSWSGLPQDTKSLALIVDDPDAPDPAKPKMTWVHWLLYNIPPTVTELPQAVTVSELPVGTLQGKNDWKRTGYGGPCPPIGRHRYFHKLYALDIELPDLHHPDKAQLEKAMAGHIIGQAELMGTYQR